MRSIIQLEVSQMIMITMRLIVYRAAVRLKLD